MGPLFYPKEESLGDDTPCGDFASCQFMIWDEEGKFFKAKSKEDINAYILLL
jgi:hypothetical protein